MTDQPKPVFVVIGIVALALIGASAYVGLTAENSAMEAKAGTAHATTPSPATPPH